MKDVLSCQDEGGTSTIKTSNGIQRLEEHTHTGNVRFLITIDAAEKYFGIPVHVVALHSWVWLVFATETEVLQREILGVG